MKRAMLFLLTSSCLFLPFAGYDAHAKSPKSNHGVAFEQAKERILNFDAIQTASGDEVAHDLKDGHIVKPPIEEVVAQSPVTSAASNSEQIPAPQNIVAKINSTTCTKSEAGDRDNLFSFYYAAPANIEKIPSGLRLETTAGTTQYNGVLYHLRTVEILANNTPVIKLHHQSDDGKTLVVVVPVVVGEVGDQDFDLLLLMAKSSSYINMAGLVPISHEYTKCAEGGVLMLVQPIPLSAKQIERLK